MRPAPILLLLLLGACANAKPGTVVANRRDIPPGPGLLTGKTGELVILPGAGEAVTPNSGHGKRG